KKRIGRCGGQRLAQIRVDASRVRTGIQRRQDALTIRTDPLTDVEGCSFRSLLTRVVAAARRRGAPGELLGGEAFHAGMRQNRREGSRKSKAIGKHVLHAGLAEFVPEPFVAVENL